MKLGRLDGEATHTALSPQKFETAGLDVLDLIDLCGGNGADGD